MALWAKIQSVSSACKGKILALYEEPSVKDLFPVEIRDTFAQKIEGAVCGPYVEGVMWNVDAGLDPQKFEHQGEIFIFLTELVASLEEKLGQGGSDCNELSRLRLTCANFKAKMDINFVELFGMIRTRIQAEIDLVFRFQCELDARVGSIVEEAEADPFLAEISKIREELSRSDMILKKIQFDVENIAVNYGSMEHMNGILENIKQRFFDYSQAASVSLERLNTSQNEIRGRISRWKYEWQRRASGVSTDDTFPLENLQIWSVLQADQIWDLYLQLAQAELHMQNVAFPFGVDIAPLTSQVTSLLGELLNVCFIVESQPQVIKTKTCFRTPVVVTLLIGPKLVYVINDVSTKLIAGNQTEDHPQRRTPPIGDIHCGQKLPLAHCGNKWSVEFKNMQVKLKPRTASQMKSDQKVNEEKHSLQFTTMVQIGNLQFPISTTSFPLVIVTHGSQTDLAAATIAWDNAFLDVNRECFQVPGRGHWSDVLRILNAQSVTLTGLPLTAQNEVSLTRKLFGDQVPDTITWKKLCKEHLPGRNFSFWEWFYHSLYQVAVPVVRQRKSHLHDLYEAKLVVGFIDKEMGAEILLQCEPGTFLLRFVDSLRGAISVSLLTHTNEVQHIDPASLDPDKMANQIKVHPGLKYVYDMDGQISPKKTKFANFKMPKPKPPYVYFGDTLPIGPQEAPDKTPMQESIAPPVSPFHIVSSPLAIHPPSVDFEMDLDVPRWPGDSFHDMLV